MADLRKQLLKAGLIDKKAKQKADTEARRKKKRKKKRKRTQVGRSGRARRSTGRIQADDAGQEDEPLREKIDAGTRRREEIGEELIALAEESVLAGVDTYLAARGSASQWDMVGLRVTYMRRGRLISLVSL